MKGWNVPIANCGQTTTHYFYITITLLKKDLFPWNFGLAIPQNT